MLILIYKKYDHFFFKKNTFKVILLLFTLLINITHKGLSQKNKTPIIHSNKSSIKVTVNGSPIEWSIVPSLKPDYLRLYRPTEKTLRIKFITDIDSIEFNSKVNQPILFSIILKNKDTALTAIDFTNSFANTLSLTEKTYALSLFWSEAKYNFAFIDKLNFDLDSLYKSYYEKIVKTTNDYDFYDEMKRFAACFKDAHTTLYYKDESTYTDYISISCKFFNDDLQITSVRKDLAEKYPVGSKIVSINGLSVKEYMDKYVDPYIYSDFEPTKRNLEAMFLFRAKSLIDSITIRYITPNGEVRKGTPPRDGRIKENIESSLGYHHSYWKQPLEITWPEEKIALLKLNTFADSSIIKSFEAIKDTLYSARGIIIDLRRNGGGGSSIGWHFLKYIIKDSFFLPFAWQTRINNGVKRANGNYISKNADFLNNRAYETFQPDKIYIPNTFKRFNVPIAILFSENTVSAAEDFLIVLKERKDRPLFIGRPSFGSTGSPLVLWNFPKNGSARICTRRVLYPYSLKPFTEGIQPDILVNYTFEEYMNQAFDKDVAIAIKNLFK